MPVIPKGRIHPLQQSAFFDEDVVLAVDQDVGDLGVPQQGLQRTETEDFIQQISLDSFLLVVAERHLLVRHDFLDDAQDRLTCLAGIDARKLLQIELGDQGAVYLRFVIFKIQ